MKKFICIQFLLIPLILFRYRKLDSPQKVDSFWLKKKLAAIVCVFVLPIVLSGQAGTSITLTGTFYEGGGYTRVFEFSGNANGKNNYLGDSGNGIYWNSQENRWEAAINEEFFSGITIGTSNLDSPNPPSFASGQWNCTDDGCIQELSGDGTVTPPILLTELPVDDTYTFMEGEPCTRSYETNLTYRVSEDATFLQAKIYVDDVEFENGFGQDQADPTLKILYVGLGDGFTPNSFGAGNHEITIEATDSEGLTTVTEFTIFAPETESPFITCPDNLIETATDVLPDGNGGFYWASSTIDMDLTEIDGCGLQSEIDITLENLETNETIPWSFPNNVTIGEWRVNVSADNGNIAECSFNVTLNSQPSPIITGPSTIDLVSEGCPLQSDFSFEIEVSQSNNLMFFNEEMSESTGISHLSVSGNSIFTVSGTITDPSNVSLSIIFDSGSNEGQLVPSSFSVPYEPTFLVPICGCTDANSVNYDPDATTDDGSCAGDLSCIETPASVPSCHFLSEFSEELLPCYDIDGDGDTDIGIANTGTLESTFWGETSAFVKVISNPNSTFPLVVNQSDLDDGRIGFQLDCGNCSALVVFVLESGVTAYLTAMSDGTVTNMGLTNAEEITFTGMNDCPSTCGVSIADVEVTNPQCTDDMGSINIEAVCVECTNDLEYKLNEGEWQNSNVFGSLMPGEYEVAVREMVDGATNCEATQSITITEPTDTQAPNVICPSESISITLDDESGTYTLTEADIISALSGVSDNCSEFGQLNVTSSITTFSCDDVEHDQTIDYMVTDEANNTATCPVSIEIGVEASNISIADAELVEGNAGTTNMNFTVSRASATCPASVDWATSDVTAEAGSDYVAVSSQTINFAAGETSKEIAVVINGDEELEENQTFIITLSNADGPGISISNANATGTIINDEIIPNYAVGGNLYERLQDAIDALGGVEGNIFLQVENYEDSSVTTIPANATLVIGQDKSLTFTNDITVDGEIGSRGTIMGNLTINGKYYGGGSVDGSMINNGVLMIGGNLPTQTSLNGNNSNSN